jgi:hypothetical protein
VLSEPASEEKATLVTVGAVVSMVMFKAVDEVSVNVSSSRYVVLDARTA